MKGGGVRKVSSSVAVVVVVAVAVVGMYGGVSGQKSKTQMTQVGTRSREKQMMHDSMAQVLKEELRLHLRLIVPTTIHSHSCCSDDEFTPFFLLRTFTVAHS